MFAADEGLVGDLALDFSVKLEAAEEVMGVGEITAKDGKAAVGLVAGIFEFGFGAPHSADMKDEGGGEFGEGAFSDPSSAVVDPDGEVGDGGDDGIGTRGEGDILVEFFVVDTEADGLEEAFASGEANEGAESENLTASCDCGAS